jgi:hypothetical protein
VTFTKKSPKPTIQEWFGSSGGGLPRRLGLKSPRRFFAWGWPRSAVRRAKPGIFFELSPYLQAVYFEHPAQYPPISNRDTTIRNRQSFSTCPFNFSKMSLTNSMIFPQRKQAMWM